MKKILVNMLAVLFLCAIALIMSWKYFDNQLSSSPSQKNSNFDAAKTVVSQISDLDKKQNISEEKLETVNSGAKTKLIRTQEVQEWQQNQFGVLNSVTVHSDYKTYDIETLKLLAGKGDTIALDFLGYKYALSSEHLKSMQAYKESAVYGSTAALVFLSFLKRGAADPKIPFSRDREFFTYLQTAYLRGDREALNLAQEYLDKKEIEFTLKDREYIQQNGRRIFNELVEERKKKKLLDFRNDFPDFVLTYNQSVESKSKSLLEGDQAIFVKPL